MAATAMELHSGQKATRFLLLIFLLSLPLLYIWLDPKMQLEILNMFVIFVYFCSDHPTKLTDFTLNSLKIAPFCLFSNIFITNYM